MADRRETAPAALLRLYTLLTEEHGIHPAVDHDAEAPAFLHAGCVNISATAPHYRIDHIDSDGETRRTITLAHPRIDDAVRLVRAYLTSRHQHAKPDRSTQLPHAEGRS